MFSWLCTKAEPRTGMLRTSWTILAGQTRLDAQRVEKLCRGSADAATDITSTGSSKPEVRFDRAEVLAAAPRAPRETVELYWLKTGRDDLTPDDLSALRELDQAHTPAVIQKAITGSVERFTRRGEDPRGVTFRYVWDSLRRFATRKAPAATTTPSGRSIRPGSRGSFGDRSFDLMRPPSVNSNSGMSLNEGRG
jgi:hypothetical protein